MPQKEIFVATGILVFDFELFIGEPCQTRRADSVSSCQPFECTGVSVSCGGDFLFRLFHLLGRREFLKQMLGENGQIMDVDDAIPPRHRADVA